MQSPLLEGPSPLGSGSSGSTTAPRQTAAVQSAIQAAELAVVPPAFWFSVGVECDQLVSSQVGSKVTLVNITLSRGSAIPSGLTPSSSTLISTLFIHTCYNVHCPHLTGHFGVPYGLASVLPAPPRHQQPAAGAGKVREGVVPPPGKYPLVISAEVCTFS